MRNNKLENTINAVRAKAFELLQVEQNDLHIRERTVSCEAKREEHHPLRRVAH